MKKKKAPGPDGIRVELFKYMDDESLSIVLEEINTWRREKLLSVLAIANIVTIKKRVNWKILVTTAQ